MQHSFALKNDDKFDKLLSLDLEQLLRIEIKTSLVSKHEEAIKDAGGAVTLYTDQDIKKLGYYTLAELTNKSPGFHSNYEGGETGLGTRGFRGTEFENGKHLLLIDGIPFHHLRSNKIPVEYELPLNFAEQVQFLRGPGSMLYGANAFYGVIDVKPKTPTEKGIHGSVFARYGGPFEKKHVTADFLSKSEFGETNFSLGYYDSNSSAYSSPRLSDPDAKIYDQQQSDFLFLKHKIDSNHGGNLSLGLIYNNRLGSRGPSGGGSISSPDNDLEWKILSPYVKFEKQWSDKISTQSHIRYNESTETGTIIRNTSDLIANNYKIDMKGYGVQTELIYQHNKNTDLLFGVDFDSRKVRDYLDSYVIRTRPTGPERDENIPNVTSSIKLSGLYGQLRYENDAFLEGSVLTLGGRYTHSSFTGTSYDNFSPKISFVQRLNKNLNAKFLYGSSFRTPSSKEITQNFTRAERAELDPVNLKPELLESFEVGLIYSKSHFSIEASLYDNELKDGIIGVTTSNARFNNSREKLKTVGGEISLNYKVNDNFNFELNHSFVDIKSENSNETSAIPKQTTNLILNYSDTLLGKPVNYTMVNHLVNGYTSNAVESHADNGFGNNFDGYFVSDINISSKLSKKLTAGLQIKNIFNDNHRFPTTSPEVNRIHERSIFGYLNYSF